MSGGLWNRIMIFDIFPVFLLKGNLPANKKETKISVDFLIMLFLGFADGNFAEQKLRTEFC